MNIQQRIEGDLKKALTSGDQIVVSTLRMLKSAVHNKEISQKKKKLSDEEIQKVLTSEKKKRQDSIDAFRKGGRDDLVAQEEKESKIIEQYLPEQLSEEEIKKVVQGIMTGMNDEEEQFGKIMSQVMAKVKGQADGRVVSRAVKEALSSKNIN